MEQVQIYALRDPRDGNLRYIGKANNAEKRLKSHMKDSRHRKTPVYAWFRKLAAQAEVLAAIEQITNGNA